MSALKLISVDEFDVLAGPILAELYAARQHISQANDLDDNAENVAEEMASANDALTASAMNLIELQEQINPTGV